MTAADTVVALKASAAVHVKAVSSFIGFLHFSVGSENYNAIHGVQFMTWPLAVP